MESFWNDVLAEAAVYYNWLVELMPKLALASLVLLFIWPLAARLRRFSRKRLLHRMDDPLLADFLSKLIRYTLLTLGLLLILQIIGLGAAVSKVLAGAGISAFIIGFAFKDIGENFLAGIMMAFKRPFRVGDVVEIGNVEGTIIGLSLRDTQVKTFDGKDVYVPNGMILKNPIVNYTIDGYLRSDFELGVDPESDLRKAIETIYEALKKVPGMLWEGKKPTVAINEVGASAINLKVFFWINTFDKNVSGLQVKTDSIRESILALGEAGFYMPADVVELKNYQGKSFVAS